MTLDEYLKVFRDDCQEHLPWEEAQTMEAVFATRRPRSIFLELDKLHQAGRIPEGLLQEADRLSPGFVETARARTEIAQVRAERGQRYRERYQYNAAIEQALSTYALWEADGLIAEALQRFPNDPGFRAQAKRLCS